MYDRKQRNACVASRSAHRVNMKAHNKNVKNAFFPKNIIVKETSLLDLETLFKAS